MRWGSDGHETHLFLGEKWHKIALQKQRMNSNEMRTSWRVVSNNYLLCGRNNVVVVCVVSGSYGLRRHCAKKKWQMTKISKNAWDNGESRKGRREEVQLELFDSWYPLTHLCWAVELIMARCMAPCIQSCAWQDSGATNRSMHAKKRQIRHLIGTAWWPRCCSSPHLLVS